jgi:hypothetical protein
MEKKNMILSKLRIESSLGELLNRTLEFLNKNQADIVFDLATLRRMAYKHFCNKVLVEGLNLNFVPQRATK